MKSSGTPLNRQETKMSKCMEKVKAMVCRVICHQVMYAWVALAYGAELLGYCEKEVTEAAVVTAYALMAARG